MRCPLTGSGSGCLDFENAELVFHLKNATLVFSFRPSVLVDYIFGMPVVKMVGECQASKSFPKCLVFFWAHIVNGVHFECESFLILVSLH